MSGITEEPWIDSQVVQHPLPELEDCSIAIDATYYLQLIQATHPYNEPLLPALGGPTGIRDHLEMELDKWKAHKMTPFFIFDGQSIVGQDEVTVKKGLDANHRTAQAWELYFNGRANEAVGAFGQVSDAYRAQNLYPLLQSILRERGLHFLVAPFQASAQVRTDRLTSQSSNG
ncbi:PIN domain-like protein [Rhypophila decipiens]|uniref:PIN domain-like protein n=1 Tax=Rhypophila decipiens TaxID=261697 RepID=A0AAN7BD29_9PEZI|nr:PIN domain-like protein [Rhypophila decipiens]